VEEEVAPTEAPAAAAPHRAADLQEVEALTSSSPAPALRRT
jgi:hypothetical protein